MTDAFGIVSATKIIHTVGPVYDLQPPAESARLLADCYRNSLTLATRYRSIAFPAISTGVYGYPIADAAAIAVGAIREWLGQHPETALEIITLVAHSDADLRALRVAI